MKNSTTNVKDSLQSREGGRGRDRDLGILEKKNSKGGGGGGGG